MIRVRLNTILFRNLSTYFQCNASHSGKTNMARMRTHTIWSEKHRQNWTYIYIYFSFCHSTIVSRITSDRHAAYRWRFSRQCVRRLLR